MIKNFFDWIYEKLKRETSSGNFMPEIDGLRFLAIAIVIFYHVQLFYVAFNVGNFDYNNFTYYFFKNGFKGVEIFFVISGFILAMPFAKHYLKAGTKPIIKNYYIRRLTRLEPPYFLALLIFFSLHLLKGVYSFDDIFHGLLQNILYIQNFSPFENAQGMMGAITWTLEVEVQFYLLAPLLAIIFSFDKLQRRLLLLAAIFVIPVINTLWVVQYASIYTYIFYFLIGFLIADLYLTEKRDWVEGKIGFFIGLTALVVLYFIDIDQLLNKLLFIAALFLFIYSSLTVPIWRNIFSLKIFTTIGGMCYSIYLFHTVLISIFGHKTVLLKISDSYEINIVIQIILLLLPILIISSIYFILIEKPCMDKNWPTNLSDKINNFLIALGLKKINNVNSSNHLKS